MMTSDVCSFSNSTKYQTFVVEGDYLIILPDVREGVILDGEIYNVGNNIEIVHPLPP